MTDTDEAPKKAREERVSDVLSTIFLIAFGWALADCWSRVAPQKKKKARKE